jgi:hypothetical protein
MLHFGREVGSQKLEDQGQGYRWLEAITRVGQDPAWVVVPGWMDGWMLHFDTVFGHQSQYDNRCLLCSTMTLQRPMS